MRESRGAVRSRPETTPLAIRRTFLSQRRAHAYSVARIASPIGMTMNAGPGKTSRATPISRTVAPTTDTITRLTTLIFSRFQTLGRRFVHDGESIDCLFGERSLILITSSHTAGADRCRQETDQPFIAARKRSRRGTCACLSFRRATPSVKNLA